MKYFIIILVSIFAGSILEFNTKWLGKLRGFIATGKWQEY